MIFNKRLIYFFIFSNLVLLTPFLDYLLNNLNSDDSLTVVSVNFLTYKRLSFLYFIIIIVSFTLYLLISYVTNSKNIDIITFILSTYYLIFSYSLFKDLLNHFNTKNFNLIAIDGYISLLLIIIIFFVIFYYIFIKKNKFIINFLIIFLLLNFVNSFSKLFILNKQDVVEINSKNFIDLEIKKKKTNNIYFLILDAMPPLDLADSILNTNSIEFERKLNEYDFNYQRNTINNYGNTFLSLGSIFNLSKFEFEIEEISNFQNLLYPTVLRNNNSNLKINLDTIGYELKWLGSHFADCYEYNKKLCLVDNQKQNLFFNYEILNFLERTPVEPIFFKISNYFNLNFSYQIIFKSNNAIKNLIQNKDNILNYKKPLFIFVHQLVSHWPYLVDRNCNYKYHNSKIDKNGIKEAFECNKKMILEFAKFINMHDKEATVIIQSDHNWELSNLDKNIYGDRRRIFSMIKVPNKCKTYHTQNINNFNAARLALYCATGNSPKLIDINEIK